MKDSDNYSQTPEKDDLEDINEKDEMLLIMTPEKDDLEVKKKKRK